MPSARRSLVVVGLHAAFALACSRRAAPPIPPRADDAGARVEDTPHPSAPGRRGGATLAPLRDAAWLEPLDLGGGDSAVVAVPLGATEPRPILLAVHGAGDRPEWACGGWRLGNDAFPFIVCPRGSRLASGSFAWGSAGQIERVSLAAVDAVRRRFAPYVEGTKLAYAGFSQGATAAEPFLSAHASLFDVILLAEGAYASTRSPAFARRLQAAGVRRVVLVCGTASCFASARASRAVLARAGLTVFVGGDAASGHNLNLPMQRALRRSWGDWVAGVAGWEAFAPPAPAEPPE